jgi:fibronectin-binding autotransporter adhesin
MRFPLPVVVAAWIFVSLTTVGRTQAVVTETFTNATTTNPSWVFAGTGFTPFLTSGTADPAGDGWLRLTSTGTNQATSAYFNSSFTAANATVYASFDYASWGGSGADGLVFFLFDGSKAFSVGADGGSLGYAQKTGVSGLNGGYIGVAVDEFGNFSNGTEGRTGGIGFTPDSFAVRGPGTGTTGYDYLGGTTSLATSIDTPSAITRPAGTNSIQLLLSPTNQLTVTLQQGGSAAQTVLSMDLSGYARPETLKFGFSSGTGASTNFHEVRNLNVTTLVANLWDGGAGDGLWASANNWNSNIVPSAGSDILLDNTHVSTAQTIDTGSNRTVRSLQIDAPFNYTVNQNTVTFDAGSVPGFTGIAVTQTRGSANHTVNSALALNNDIGIRQNSTGTLSLTGNVSLGAHTAAFDGTGNTTVTGVVSGTGDLTKAQSGTVFLNAANTYSGGTTVSGGTLSTNNNAGFGTGAITLSGGTIASSAANTIGNAITLAGSGGISGLNVSNTVTQSGGNRTLNLANSTLAGTVNLSNDNTGRTLTTQVDSGTSTISGVIANGGSGAGSLTKTGFGTLNLSGASTYTGTTTVSEGVLQLGASDRLANTSTLNVAGGTLNLNTFSEQVGNLNFSNSGTIDFGAQTGANYFLFANTTGTPSGVLTISNWEGGTDVLASSSALSATILDQLYFVGYGSGATQGSATTVGSYGGGWLPINPNTNNWYTWDSGNNTNRWDRAANWVGDVTPPSSNTTKVAFGTGAQTTVDLRANRTVNAMRFDAGSASFNIGNSQAYTLTFDGPNAGSVAFIQQNSANAQSLTMGTVNLAKNTVVDMAGAGNLTISSSLTGSANLVKENTGGTLILSGSSSSYTGNIFVNAGTLQIQNNNALGSSATGNTTVLDGGTLALSGTITSAENITVTGAGVGGAGAIKAVSGTSTLTGTTTLSGSTTIGATTGNTLAIGAITSANQNLTTTGAGNTNLTGAITTGTGSLTINATGTTTMTGAANTFTGTTTVNAGTLVLNKTAGTNAIASGNLIIGDGSGTDTVRLDQNNQIGDTVKVTVNSSGVFNLNGRTETIAALEGSSGASVNLGAGVLNLSGSSQTVYDGTLSGSGTLNKSGTGKISLSANQSGFSGPVNLSGGIVNVAGTASNMLGTGAVAISGTGNLEVQGGAALANAFTLNSYGTGANDGAIQNIAGSNTVTGAVTLAGNSRVQSDAGTLTFSNTVALGANTLNVGGTGNTAISGAISGTGGLSKDGSGTLNLSGVNNFTGSVVVNAGTLQLGANNVVPNGASVGLAAGATLDLNGKTDTFTGLSGSGTLLMNGGDLTLLGSNTFNGSISGAGTLSISNSLTLGSALNNSNLVINLAGTLNLGPFANSAGTLNLTGNSILDFGNTTATQLNLSSINLNGYTLSITNWANTVDYFTAQNWIFGLGTAPTDVRGAPPMSQVTFSGFSNNSTVWQSYDRQITPAPEPATYGAIFTGLCVAGLGFRRWRLGRRPRV